MHGTERLIKTAFNEVDSTLKTDGGYVSNNEPVYLYTACNKSFWNFLFTHFSTTTAQNLTKKILK